MDVRVLGDWDDPCEMVKGILKELASRRGARIATSTMPRPKA
jgi:Xaa-Pro dipeptidase